MAIFRSAFVVSSLTLVSRILGFVRDIVIAKFLGVSVASDAFFAAFKTPNLFRKIFAEGAFNSAFIPLFSSYDAKSSPKNKERAMVFARNVFSLLLYSLLILILLFEIFMPWVMRAIVPGFVYDADKFDFTVSLARVTFPYLIFISLVSLLTGISNSFGRFAWGAFVPVILNVTLIVAVFVAVADIGGGKGGGDIGADALNEAYTPLGGVPVSVYGYGIDYAEGKVAVGLSWGVFAAGVLQFVMVFFASLKRGALLYPVMPKIDTGVRDFFKRFVPGVIGAGIMQVNVLVDMLMATLISGAVSYLYYADRVAQFPLALIGTAIGIVLLPALSRKIQSGDAEEAMALQNRALEVSMFLAIPAMAGLFVIADDVIATLFGRGRFGVGEVVAVANALQVFVCGLPAFILVKILTPNFFARKDTKTPMRIALICLVCNVVMNLAFIRIFGYLGIVLATVIASWVNVLLLLWLLAGMKAFLISSVLMARLLKILFAAALMGFLLNYCSDYFMNLWWFESYEINRAVGLMTLILSGGCFYLLISYLVRTFGRDDVKMLFR